MKTWMHAHISDMKLNVNSCVLNYVIWWLCSLVKLGELCEFGDLVNHTNLWLMNYVTWWFYLMMFILLMVMKCESYVIEMVIFLVMEISLPILLKW